ncbi:MAG: hypothetical protein OHK0022_12070 [Roseiflexaceae bacterium]
MTLAIKVDPVPLKSDRDGVFRIGNTRVTLDTVIGAFHNGATAEEIAQQYPSLYLADVYAVIAYYLRHRSDVQDYLNRRQQFAKTIRQYNEQRFHPDGIRDRLIARQMSTET